MFLSNVVARILGFLYKVFLSRTIGESFLGMYYIIFNFLMMCIAFTTTGMPTALSCLVASKKALNDHHNSNVLFISSLYITFFISLILSLFISLNSRYLSFKILKNSNFNLFILAICPAIILISISNILRAYYYGLKDVLAPAISQIIEQVVRVLFVILLLLFINNDYLNCYVALLGISFGEIANILFLLFSLYKNSNVCNIYIIKLKDFYYSSLETIKMSVPITCNRMSIIIINSISSIIIPNRLILAGITYKDALSIYGIVNGMVLPLVYLPLTLCSALVVNLIPSISQELILHKYENIKKKIIYSLLLSLFVGSFCSIFFYLFSNHLCLIMFNNKLAGIYLKSMYLAPLFISLNQTLSGILQSIRKEFLCSIITIFCMIVQLLLIYILIPIPSFNIYAYIYIITVVSMITCLLYTIVLIKSLKFLNLGR